MVSFVPFLIVKKSQKVLKTFWLWGKHVDSVYYVFVVSLVKGTGQVLLRGRFEHMSIAKLRTVFQGFDGCHRHQVQDKVEDQANNQGLNEELRCLLYHPILAKDSRFDHILPFGRG